MKKKKLMNTIFRFSTVIGFGFMGLIVSANGKADEIPVQMLGINDFHGALSTTGSYYGPDGSKVSNTGTAPLLAGYFNQVTTTFNAATNNAGVSYRVQAGDMVGASPANSSLLQDQSTMRVIQSMGFDVGTLGNHEFDEGLAEYNRILTGAKPAEGNSFYEIVNQYNSDYTQNQLKGNFDLTIANVKDKLTGQNPFGWKDYVIKEKKVGENTIKIGFIGVVTTEIPNLVLAQYHQDYNFTDPAEAIADSSKELKKLGVEAIVVLGHTPSVQGTGDTASGETATIINKVNQLYPDNSVDAYFSGHNHVYTNAIVDNTRVVQSTSQGKGYINLTGNYDTDTDDFTDIPNAEVKPVNPTQGVEVDSDVKTIVDDASTRVKAVTENKIGTAATNTDITREANPFGESAVGNLITDGQVYMAKKAGQDVDFALTNNGGIRADLKVEPDGTITWGAAQAVQPFGNIMQVVEMTGAQIRAALNQQTFGGSTNYFLQASGLKYSLVPNTDSVKTITYPYVVKDLTKSDGTPIEDTTTYKLIINDFLYGGGDGFSAFTEANLIGAIDPDTETFIGYIEDLEGKGEKISASIEGRRVIVDPSEDLSMIKGSDYTMTLGDAQPTAADFKASATDITGNPIDVTIDFAKVDFAKAGTYPVLLKAANGKTKTVNLTIKEKAADMVKVTFNSGKGGVLQGTTSLSVAKGTKLTNLPKPVADKNNIEDIYFLDWYQNGKIINPKTIVINQDTTFTAKFGTAVYRLYNANDGDHLLTKNKNEKNAIVAKGWKLETNAKKEYGQAAFYVPVQADSAGKKQVYRIYNPNSGEHFYTTNKSEADAAVKKGWRHETNKDYTWVSDGDVKVYREFNPNNRTAGSHNFTTDLVEHKNVVKAGWRDESKASSLWTVLKAGF